MIVHVRLADLKNALADVSAMQKKGKAFSLGFEFENGTLTVSGPGAASTLGYEGVASFVGQLRIESADTFAKKMRQTDPMPLELGDGFIGFDGTKIVCETIPIPPPLTTELTLTAKSGEGDIMRAVVKTSLSAVAEKIGGPAVVNAHKVFERALGGATSQLRAFDIDKDALRAFVIEQMQR